MLVSKVSALFACLLDEWEHINLCCGKEPTAHYLEEKYKTLLSRLLLPMKNSDDDYKELSNFLTNVLEERRERIRNALHWKHDPLSCDYALVHLCYLFKGPLS